MQKQDKGRLTLILNKMSELYPKDITEDLLEIYVAALDGYDMERIARAFMEYVKHEGARNNFPVPFPVPAKIIEYYNGLPHERALALLEPELTAEEKRRTDLVSFYMTRWSFVDDEEQRKRLLAECGDEAALERFIKKHWHSNLKKMRQSRETRQDRRLRVSGLRRI